MLVSMTVRNIALIEHLNMEFHKGLHVLTGETGAGKSIVVDSLNLVLGERADRGLIRSGCEKASVEALIDITDSPQVQALLSEQALEAEGGLLSIQREITAADRNICRVCGVIVPLSFLKQITVLLVDIHGQHEHQSLLDVKNHLGFLDSFGDDAFREQQKCVSQAFLAWKKSSQRFSALRKESAQREERQAFLQSRLKELESAQLEYGEAERLFKEKEQFSGVERINEAVEYAYQATLTGQGTQGGAAASLKNAAEKMGSIALYDDRYKALSERLQNVYYEVEELGFELRDALATIRFDPERNEVVQERLDQIRQLERRFGMTADALVSHYEVMKEESDRMETMEDRLKSAEAAYKAKLTAYRKQAAALTERRLSLADHFEQLMEAQMGDLGMGKTHFKCVFAERPTDKRVIPTEQGDDHVEFFIAPNPGEPLKPLHKTASGGELSRLMLAMKTAAADRTMVPCMIFDEVDTGISGQVAGVVAQKMAQLGHYRQVICVTHLAQIAAMADVQYHVSKAAAGARTVTSVRQLGREERAEELARLMGGTDQRLDSAMAHARHMMESAEEYKAKNNF